MRKLLFTFIATICYSFASAGPFGIEMGMTLAQIRAVCKTVPEPVGDNKYYITPPKTNGMFEKYLVQIDPEYGVCWLKAIGKDIYTNGYGERLKSTFENLVESIRNTYGDEPIIKDELKEGSVWGDPDNFMYALERGDRRLFAVWHNSPELHELISFNHRLRALNELLDDPHHKDSVLNYMETRDSIALNSVITSKTEKYKRIPKEIEMIYVGVNTISASKGWVSLEYQFSNYGDVKIKADSVF